MSQTDPVEWKLYKTDFATVEAILPVAAGATLYLELNEPGSGSVTIPANCHAASHVSVNKFIACYYRGVYRGGFLVDDIETVGASSGEHGDAWMKISGRGPLALMSEGILWALDGKETSRDFDDKSAAYVVLTVWTEAEARGALQNTAISFDADYDSASSPEAFDDLDDHKFANGITVLDVIRDIAKLGFEFSMDFDGAGTFTLNMFKSHIGSDVSGTIFFRTGVNCEEVGEDKKSDELKNALLIKYAGGYTSVKDTPSVNSHRRRETLFHADEANAAKLGRRWGHAIMGTMKEPKVEVAVRVYDGMPPSAFVDYDMGDTVALDNQGTVMDYRVLGMELTWDHEYASVEVELSSRYTQHDIRVAQDVERLKRLYTQAHDADLLEVSYWAALGDIPWGEPLCMAQIGMKIYVAGLFSHIGNVQVNNIACYDTETGLWSCLPGENGQNGVDNAVYCLLADGTNLYMGGFFNALGTGDVDDDPGIVSYNVGMWDTVGSTWGMINPNPLSGGAVNALAMVDSFLYVGGNFISVWDDEGDPIPDTTCIFKTVPTSGVASSLGVGQSLPYSCIVLCSMGLTLYAGTTSSFKAYNCGEGGGFWSDVFVGGLTYYPIAMLNVEDLYLYVGTSGGVMKFDSVAATWEVLASNYGACNSLATDGLNVYAGGTFTAIGGVTGARCVAFTDDSSWYGMGGGAAGNVTGIVCLNETVYICGGFHTVGGPTGTKKAALHLAAYIGSFYPMIESLEHQADVQWGEITGDIEDQLDLIAELDKHVNIAQGENSRVVVTSSTGDVTTDADLLYDAANNALTIGSEALPITVANALNVIAASGSLARLGFVFADTLDNSDYDASVRAGGTFAAPTSILTDMVLKKWRGRGYYNNSSGISTTAVEIRAVADGNWSASSWPTRVEVWTTAVDSVTLTKALTVGSDGILYDGAGDPIGGGATAITEDTYANIEIERAAGTLTPNAQIIVTDRCDLGMLLTVADDPTVINYAGIGGWLNCDFQAVGNYDGVVGLTGVAVGTTRGVWYADLEDLPLVTGDIVFWNLTHYQLIDDAEMDGTDPATNTVAYQVLPRATAEMGYIAEYDPIEYDWTNDWLQYREDKRGNKYRYSSADIGEFGQSAIPLFQWGRNTVYSNVIDNAFFDIRTLPASCQFYNNTFAVGGNFSNTFAIGVNFFGNAFAASCQSVNNTFAASCSIYNNSFMTGCSFSANAFAASCQFVNNTIAATTTGESYSGTYSNNTLLAGIVDIPSGSTYNIDGSPHGHDVDEVIIPGGMGTPTYDDLYDFLNMTQSSGRLTGGALTAHTDGGADGTLDIAEMEGMIHTANTLGSPLIYFKKAAVAEIALTDLAVNYIIVTYTAPGGTPTLTYSASASRPAANTYNAFVVGRCWRSGNDVEVLTTGQNIYDIYGRQQDRLLIKYGTMDHASGSTLSAHATALRMTCDSGVWFFGNTRVDTDAANTFSVWYKTGGGAWTESASCTLFSEVFDGGTSKVYETYQNGTSLGALGANAYGVYWIFECPEGDLYVVLGTASYSNIGSAQTATLPASLPPYCANWSKLIGRVIVKKTEAAFYSVESVWTTSFALTAGTYVPTDRVITATAPITIAGTTSADLSADRTIAIPAATAAVNGYATSVQITKLDGITAGADQVVAETNAYDIFSVTTPGGTSVFAALLNGDPTNVANSVCTFDTVSAGAVAVITPTATTQLAKLTMYNTTRGTSALILSATGATFTTTTNVYAAGWRNNDIITITSPTTVGGSLNWVDLEITSGPTSKTSLFVKQILSGTAGDFFRIHPFTASYSASKIDALCAQVTARNMYNLALVSVISNKISISWTGDDSVWIRESGYIT
jgi:hypothetical protein